MGIISGIKRILGRDKEEPLVSLVLLRRRPKNLNVRNLGEATARALGIPPGPYSAESTNYVVGEPPMFMVKKEDWFFLVHCHAVPYIDKRKKWASEIHEGRLRNAVAEHRAWVSVDVMNQPAGSGVQQTYAMIGKLLAELTDADCLAVYSPQFGTLRAYDEEVPNALRSNDPLSTLREPAHPPVLEVPEDDARLQAAVQEARSRFPEFVRAFEQRNGEHFSVKGPFTDGKETEFMWINVRELTTSTIKGALGNEPAGLSGLKEGDPVELKLDDVNDWMYIKDEQMIGGFTLEALAAAQEPQ